MKKDLLKRLKADIEKSSINAVAQKIGIAQPTLWRLINGKYDGRMSTWETIENYYNNA
jgi:DNA transposition AAA+ family ATPase